jgi:hypothetical protein
MTKPCASHDHLTDDQRHILLDSHDVALVDLANRHTALRAALEALIVRMRAENPHSDVRQTQVDHWADELERELRADQEPR